jgi:hypothetical protein
VLGSFIIFKITWPDVVLSGIGFLKSAGDLIQIDLLEIPGLACKGAAGAHLPLSLSLSLSVSLSLGSDTR